MGTKQSRKEAAGEKEKERAGRAGRPVLNFYRVSTQTT